MLLGGGKSRYIFSPAFSGRAALIMFSFLECSVIVDGQ